ncbi:30S ribosomal protein S2 [Candidatus Woesearchaeota archaeon]|nr:30S ribosomal protein S2 [Candidatus Woesearchaeota archaeon]
MTQEENLLVPIDQYLKAGIHIGTKFKTTYMDAFIYKTRPDGLYVLNLQKIDERLALAAKFLAQYEPRDILVVCRRENGWKPINLFGKLTGVRVFAGRYPPGVLTNIQLKSFIEAKVLLVIDAWPDRNAINDAIKAGMPVVALCDTNNQSNNVDLVIPCNNKGKKSLGLVFYILTTEYLKNKGLLYLFSKQLRSVATTLAVLFKRVTSRESCETM